MELVKNIFFNTDKLTAGSKVKISYTGKFFQDESKQAFIKYTFEENWENAVKSEMIKTELGFQIEIELLDTDFLKFCVTNENDELDNNEGNDYIFQIEHPELALMVIDNKKPSHRLRKTYIWSKKVKLAVYKLLITIPKILTGNYKKKNDEEI